MNSNRKSIMKVGIEKTIFKYYLILQTLVVEGMKIKFNKIKN